MEPWLFTIPLFPLLGFVTLVCFGRSLSQRPIAYIGVLSVGISALITIITGSQLISGVPEKTRFVQHLWTWIPSNNLDIQLNLYLDSLALVFVFIITFVGFLIHLYAVGFMKKEEGYSRFFAYMNLFIGSMVLLVMAGNLLFLYLGWEAVGLCSYLLIGFWYKDPTNGYAARKAFIVTRVGDTLMAIGMFMLIKHVGTLNVQEIVTRIPQGFSSGSPVIVAIALLMLGGALGKSAQLPLQVWLPDAMAGPTPVSALIHAATMVTAGIYLIARLFVLFEMAPAVQLLMAIIGGVTLLLAAFSALAQSDIKRILAYSTISQIGYMFIALGVGAWSAAVFHFMTHAFFKALLFLAAGTIIMNLHHEHDIFKMGGLRKKMPLVFWTFLAGAASLAALPLVTAGFYSKDTVLWYTWMSQQSFPWLWVIGITGSLLTAIYTFRMVFVTFFGRQQLNPEGTTSQSMKVPLVVLAVFSIIAGFVNIPANVGPNLQWLNNLLYQSLPETHAPHNALLESILQFVSAIVVLAGVYFSYRLYAKPSTFPERFRKSAIYSFWSNGWRFDTLYEWVAVKPVVWLARVNKNDIIDMLSAGIANFHVWLHQVFIQTQTGRIRMYSMGIAIGIVLALFITLFT